MSTEDVLRRKPSLMRQLAAALLNATLMLFIILVVVVLLLIGKVQSFTADTVSAAVGAIGEQQAGKIKNGFGELQDMGAKVKNLQASLNETCKDGINTPQIDALRAEVQALREKIDSLNTNVHELGEKAATAAIDGAANGVKTWLGVSPATAPSQ